MKRFFRRMFCLHNWRKDKLHKLWRLYDCEMTCNKCGKVVYTNNPNAYVSIID